VRAPNPPSHRQQVQVVIAQHRDRPIAQPPDEAQRGQRGGAAVDQVAAKPQGCARRVALDALEQALQAGQATLQVTDGDRHHRGIVGLFR
jgi:hypothetical protein